ncbi:MAG: hypothetical protein ABI268_03080 [Rhodanobacter sp.]
MKKVPMIQLRVPSLLACTAFASNTAAAADSTVSHQPRANVVIHRTDNRQSRTDKGVAQCTITAKQATRDEMYDPLLPSANVPTKPRTTVTWPKQKPTASTVPTTDNTASERCRQSQISRCPFDDASGVLGPSRSNPPGAPLAEFLLIQKKGHPKVAFFCSGMASIELFPGSVVLQGLLKIKHISYPQSYPHVKPAAVIGHRTCSHFATGSPSFLGRT